jgi:3-deoxy-D-manno-octulosonic-acid transferase
MSLFYDLVLGVGALCLSFRRKKAPTFKERLGRDIPNSQGKPVLWIHAVSVGEVKAAQPLLKRLRVEYPTFFILVTTTTATGQQEAKRSLLEADAYRILPFDFSWVMNRWAKALAPKLLIFVESDFWYHLIAAVKKQGGKVILVSGKISPRSAARFLKLKPLAQKLFNCFDLLLVQNEEYRRRFAPLTSRQPLITGNLKFDIAPQPVDLASLKQQWGTGPWLTLSSTHDPEESLLLDALASLLPKIKIFLAPRHPQRSCEVAKLLEDKKIPYCLIDQPDPNARVVLIDRLGELAHCYSISFAALVAGSFTPRIGGHNILEPCLYHCPTFFGPYMQNQEELKQIVLSGGAGKELELDEIAPTLTQLLSQPKLRGRFVKNGQMTLAASRGAIDQTLSCLRSI